MPYIAKVVCDSVTDFGRRLTTMELTYPLMVHNELLTHRGVGRSDSEEYEEWLEFSRNSSSNRAIPSAKLIQAAIDDPYIPKFRYSTTGMVPGAFFSEDEQEAATNEWLAIRDKVIEGINNLDKVHKVAKQWRNRPLMAWQYITTVVTAIDEQWEHFFKLRNHPDAQDEIHTIAGMAYEKYLYHDPTVLHLDDLHLPYITTNEKFEYRKIGKLQELIPISVSRCARSSYLRQGEILAFDEDLKLYSRLTNRELPHASPLEHVAIAAEPQVRSGNFVGFLQWRKIKGF